MRNPKDVLVSSYYFHQMAAFLQDPGTFGEFMTTFLEGKGHIFNPRICTAQIVQRVTLRILFLCQKAVNPKVNQKLVCLLHVIHSVVWKMDRSREELETHGAWRQNLIPHL